MANCKDCVHVDVCEDFTRHKLSPSRAEEILPILREHGKTCELFKDRSRFVTLNIAKKIKHTPDIDKMREFHKLGLGSGMGERSIFWTCSNCGIWASLAHKFCSNCGAKFEVKQALKGCEEK